MCVDVLKMHMYETHIHKQKYIAVLLFIPTTLSLNTLFLSSNVNEGNKIKAVQNFINIKSWAYFLSSFVDFKLNHFGQIDESCQWIM